MDKKGTPSIGQRAGKDSLMNQASPRQLLL